MKKILLAILLAASLSSVAHAARFADQTIVERFDVITTSGGSTTLTVDSQKYQIFTGSSTHTVNLPSATTLRTGIYFRVSNDSTGAVTVNDNGGNLLKSVASGDYADFFLRGQADANGTWDVQSSTSSLSGNITLPGSSTDDSIVRFDGTSGSSVQDSSITIDDSDVMSGVTQLNVDNLRLDGNAITSTDTNGDITLTPDGTGTVIVGTDLDVDNINVNGNTIISTDTNGNINLTPDGSGDLVLDGLNWPQTDGSNGQSLITNGSGQLSFSTISGGGGGLGGPGSSTDNAVVRWNGTGGVSVQDSSVTIDDSDVLSGATQLNVDNLRLDGNDLSATSGSLVIGGLTLPATVNEANARLQSNGSSVLSFTVAPTSEIVLHTGNGFGSTNTKIKRWTTVATNTGSALTLTQSATNGDSITVNQDGLYFIYYSDYGTNPDFGISINSSQLTTDIQSITATDRRCQSSPSSGFVAACGVTLFLSASDVIRAHSDANATGADAQAMFYVQHLGDTPGE